jgi:flagellar hook-associated protein 2
MATGLSFTGLASGVDTDAIVTALMQIERTPQTRMQGRLDQANARLAGFEQTRGRLDALRGAADALRGVGVFSPAPWASSSDTARLTATATGSAVQASYAIEIQSLARADVRTQRSSLAAAGADDVLHVGAGTQFDVAVQAGDTISAIAGKINAAGGDVQASVVEGKLRLTSRETGTAHAVSVSSDGSLAAGLDVGSTLAATDARFTVDGVAHTRSSNTVDDAIAGATLTLRAPTTATPILLQTDPAHVDVDGVVGRVRNLVSAYNAVVDGLRGGLQEKPVADPKTVADRNRGLFFNDGAYASILDRVQRATADPVHGAATAYDQAAEIGLSGGASSGGLSADALSGRIVLDEAKLRAALAADPAAVERLLTGDGPDRDGDGLATRLSAVVAEATGSSGALGGRIETENRRAADWRASIDRMGERLDARESMLRSQFTAMERALGQLRTLQGSFASSGLLGAAA